VLVVPADLCAGRVCCVKKKRGSVKNTAVRDSGRQGDRQRQVGRGEERREKEEERESKRLSVHQER
jgi:hypothetical protein